MKFTTFIKQNKQAILFLFSTWGTYFLILWPKMLYFDSEGNLSTGWRIIWADWAMHIGQIEAFYHNPIWQVLTHHPLVHNIPLKYSFVTNLISGILMKLGANLIQATIIPSIILSLLLLFTLFYFLKQLCTDNRQILITINLFFLSGGLGFIHFFSDFAANPSLSALISPVREYTRIDDLGYYWYNTLVANFIPQRAFLLGMTITLFLSARLFHFYSLSFKVPRIKRKLFILGLFTGLLAFIHIHSLILIFLLSSFLCLFDLKHFSKWLIFCLGVFLTSFPFFYFFQILSNVSFIQFYPGWLANENALNMPFIIFWFKNWGLLIPLALFSFYQTIKNTSQVSSPCVQAEQASPTGGSLRVREIKPSLKQNSALRNHKKNIFILAFFFIFILCNLFIFQPYDWDNSKLLLWVYLIFSLLTAKLILKLWNHKFFIFKILSVLIFLSLTLSGILDLTAILNTREKQLVMISKSDLDLADQFRQISTWEDIALIPDTHLHWLPVMSGRRVFTGYSGWIWSWGMDYDTLQTERAAMYQNTPKAKELLKKNSIDFIVTDQDTQRKYWSDDHYLDTAYEKVLENQDYKVYRIKP